MTLGNSSSRSSRRIVDQKFPRSRRWGWPPLLHSLSTSRRNHMIGHSIALYTGDMSAAGYGIFGLMEEPKSYLSCCGSLAQSGLREAGQTLFQRFLISFVPETGHNEEDLVVKTSSCMPTKRMELSRLSAEQGVGAQDVASRNCRSAIL